MQMADFLVPLSLKIGRHWGLLLLPITGVDSVAALTRPQPAPTQLGAGPAMTDVDTTLSLSAPQPQSSWSSNSRRRLMTCFLQLLPQLIMS